MTHFLQMLKSYAMLQDCLPLDTMLCKVMTLEAIKRFCLWEI